MTILRPPRREPRVVALALAPHGIAFASLDPWELRSTGIESCSPNARTLAVCRIIRREKPTVVTAISPLLLENVRRAAVRHRLPVVPGDLPLPPPDCAEDLVRGMAYQAPTRTLQKVVRLALAVVLHAEETHRSYAPRKRPTLRRRS